MKALIVNSEVLWRGGLLPCSLAIGGKPPSGQAAWTQDSNCKRQDVAGPEPKEEESMFA